MKAIDIFEASHSFDEPNQTPHANILSRLRKQWLNLLELLDDRRSGSKYINSMPDPGRMLLIKMFGTPVYVFSNDTDSLKRIRAFRREVNRVLGDDDDIAEIFGAGVPHNQIDWKYPTNSSAELHNYTYIRRLIKSARKDLSVRRWCENRLPWFSRSAFFVYMYSRYILKQRWPEQESKLLSAPRSTNIPIAVDYAAFVIKDRWPELEKILLSMKSVTSATVEYAKKVIKGRWPELERKIATAPPNSSLLARYADSVGVDVNSLTTHTDAIKGRMTSTKFVRKLMKQYGGFYIYTNKYGDESVRRVKCVVRDLDTANQLVHDIENELPKMNLPYNSIDVAKNYYESTGGYTVIVEVPYTKRSPNSK